MVRTGLRATALTAELEKAGLAVDACGLRSPRLDDFDGAVARDLLALYRKLGGRQAEPQLRPGAWDLTFKGIVVELDEELHFNRYRRVTVETKLGSETPWAAFYQDACVRHEPDCLRAGRWGSRWTSRPAAVMFGPAGPPGDLADADGSPRWKQRAMYDAMKDAAALTLAGYCFARLTVWDDVAGVCLGEALEGRGSVDATALVELLTARTTVGR